VAARQGPVSPDADGAAGASAERARTPTTVTPVSPGATDRPRSFYLDEDGRLHRNLHPREIVDAVRRGTGALWVDIDSSDRHQHALLEKVFHFHPLAIEDTLNPVSRVKLEEFADHIFVIVRGVQFRHATEDPYDVETFNLCFFLGRNVLVTTHGERVPAVSAVIDRLDRSPDLIRRGPERLMHAIMDSAVDDFFPILDQVDEFIDGLEERVFGAFDETALRDIFSVKRLVLSLRRQLGPQREVFNVLTNRPTELLSRDTQVYFRDIYDHVLRITDSLDNYRELLSSTLDSYLSQVSNRLTHATKGLSLAATLSVPFVMVSGMWGMNFANIPLSQHPHGFAIMMVIQVALGLGLVALLRWRRLL
jgi:magnesium transporter